MSVSDIIQIVSIICTSILSIVAIVISVLTLIQNNKMIFESNKPYITIFPKVVSFTSPHYLLILKNFGISGATILNIEYDSILDSYFRKKPLEHMKNVFIAPNQSYVYPLQGSAESIPTINIKITYNYQNKIYTENCVVNFEQFEDVCYLKVHSSKDIEELSNVLQEITFQNI